MNAMERRDAKGREYAKLWHGDFCLRCDCGICTCDDLSEKAMIAALAAAAALVDEANPEARKRMDGCPF